MSPAENHHPKKTRGRPRMTPEQRKATRNVTLDADLLDALNTVADEFESGFHFRPTLSQTVRYLIGTRKDSI